MKNFVLRCCSLFEKRSRTLVRSLTFLIMCAQQYSFLLRFRLESLKYMFYINTCKETDSLPHWLQQTLTNNFSMNYPLGGVHRKIVEKIDYVQLKSGVSKGPDGGPFVGKKVLGRRGEAPSSQEKLFKKKKGHRKVFPKKFVSL